MKITGQYLTKLHYPDGKVEITSWRQNLIPKSAAKVISGGIGNLTNNLFHALGVGDATWNFGIPEPSRDDTGLFSEVVRRPVSISAYVEEFEAFNDASNSNPLRLKSSVFADLDVSPDPHPAVGMLVEIIAGPGAGEVRAVNAFVGPDEVTLSGGLSAAPTGQTKFRLGVTRSTPQAALDLETTFTDTNTDGSYREEAIFGADATAEIGSGQLLSVVRTPLFTKSPGVNMTRVFRLRFAELV